VGTLGIDSLVPREFTAEEIRLAKTVGEELGRALETARLYERLRTYAAELEARVNRRTRELAEANERLQELDRLKSKFVSDVSHELRTPITNLSLYLDFLHRGKPEKRESYLAIINEQTLRLGRLIEDILNLSRLELGQEKILFEASNVNALIAQIIAAHQLRAEVAGLQLHFTPDASLPAATIAPNQLSLALSNLIANAINYTESGFVHVRTRHLPDGNELHICVQDSGMGIDEEDKAHLFERFYRGHDISQSTIPGTGLGLAIVREVIDLHNGRIEVESQAGQGSTFHIWLPLQR
jgi:signal transduction histidine kinase